MRCLLRTISERLVVGLGVLFVFFAFLTASLIHLREAAAYPIRVTFQNSAGQPVPGVKVRGSHGLNRLTLLTSNTQGEWTFDTNDLSSPQAVIAFSGVAVGMSLEPAELKLSNLLATGARIVRVTASASASPSAIISWRFAAASSSAMLSGLSVGLLNPYRYSCETRVTDSDGYVVWSVPATSGSCNDSTPDRSWYRIVPYETGNVRCSTFTPLRSTGQRSCPSSADDEGGVSTSTCSAVSNLAPTLSSKLRIVVTDASSGAGVPGTEIVGNSNLGAIAARETDSRGIFQFTLSDIPGATTSTVFDLAPLKAGYEFMPRRRDSRECLLVGSNTYECEFSAVRTDASQGAIRMNVLQATQPLGGVSVVQPDAGLGCLPPSVRYTDTYGVAVLPVRVRGACSKSDGVPWNDPVTLYPSLRGKGFTSATNFEYCPTTLQTVAAIAAFDNSSGIQNLSVSGEVIGLQGLGLAGAQILMNGEVRATTDALGRFMIYPVVQGTTVKLQAQSQPLAFDPEFDTYELIAADVNARFLARAPDPLGGEIDPPPETCPVKSSYTLSGTVLDRAGHPIEGATIHDNNGETAVATTDAAGAYSFSAPYGSDHWVTVEYGDALFEPAARWFPDLACDEPGTDFQQVDYESVLLGGKVTDANGAPIAGVTVQVMVNGAPLEYDLTTGSDGRYLASIRSGANVIVSALRPPFTFQPVQHELLLEAPDTNRNFQAEAVPTPPATSPPGGSPGQPVPPTVTPPSSGPPSTPVPGDPTATPSPGQPAPGQPTLPPPAAPPSTVAPPPDGGSPPPGQTEPPGGVPLPPPPSSPPSTPPPGGGLPPDQAPVPTPDPGIVPTPPGAVPTLAPVVPTSVSPTPPTETRPPWLPPTPPGLAPAVTIRSACPESPSELPPPYKWLVTNAGSEAVTGSILIYDVTQPFAYPFTINITVVAGATERISTPDLGIPLVNYRVALVVRDGAGNEVTVAVAPWDTSYCFADQPTPAPPADGQPGEPPAPGEPVPPSQPAPGETPAAPPTQIPIDSPPSGETPVPPPALPGQPAPPPGAPQPPGSPPELGPTATPTPLPLPMYTVRVKHYNDRGKEMTEKQLSALMTSGGGIRLAARGTSYVKYLPFSELSRPDGVALTSLPAGIYTLTVEGPVRVGSFVGGLRAGRTGRNRYSVLINDRGRTVKLSVKVVG